VDFFAATAQVRLWHFSTDRGTAASLQHLGLDRTSQTLWFDAIDPNRTLFVGSVHCLRDVLAAISARQPSYIKYFESGLLEVHDLPRKGRPRNA